MKLLDASDLAEFKAILRRHRLARADFSLSATDTTDPKTDEVDALQAELAVRRASTGQTRYYLVSDSASWLRLFRNDIRGGAFMGQDALAVRRQPARQRKGAAAS